LINEAPINRRLLMGLLGGSVMATACTKGSRKRLNLDPNNPEHLHYMHRKLVYRLDDGLTYWNIEALRMGFRDGILTPFWKLHAGIIYKIKTIEAFRYSNQAIVKIFYTDLETGELLQWFDNPYTKETVEVEQPKLIITPPRIFGLKGIELEETGETSNLTRNEDIGPVRVSGDDVWLNADLIMRSEPPNRKNKLLQVNDWLTYLGKMSELSDPIIKSASASLNFNDLNTFNHSWIGMDDVEEAWSFSRGFGRKRKSWEDMPGIWKNLVSETNPELLTENPNFSTENP